MEYGTVFTDGVTVPKRLRRLDPAKVDELAESIEVGWCPLGTSPEHFTARSRSKTTAKRKGRWKTTKRT